MSDVQNHSITRVLRAASNGDRAAAQELLPLVYEELRTLAKARLRHEAPDQTLQPTALVHEAYLRLVGSDDPGWDGRVLWADDGEPIRSELTGGLLAVRRDE